MLRGNGTGEADRGIGVCGTLRWAPVPLFLGLILWLSVAPIDAIYEPRFVLLGLNLTFSTVVSLLVAALAAKSYLMGGSPSVLLLGSGMLAFGIASAMSSIYVPGGKYDAAVKIYNLGVLIAGTLTFLGAVELVMPRRGSGRGRSGWVIAAGYGAVVALLSVLTVLASTSLIAPFFVQGQGPTLLRQAVLGSATTAFSAAALLLGVTAQRTRSHFLRWYALGLALIVVGLLGVMPMQHFGSIPSWAARASQHLGGVYLLVAAIIAIRESGQWMIPIAILRETHERYASLVELCPDPIVVHIDARYVFANSAAVRLFRAQSPQELLGKSVLEVVHPAYRGVVAERIAQAQSQPSPLPLHGLVLLCLDGQPVDVEVTAVQVEYDGQRAILAVMRDITERKRAEEAMRASMAAKDQFLAALSHELRTPLTPVLAAASALVRDPRLPQSMRDDLTLIERNIGLEVALISDLLDVTRIVNGKLSLNRQRVDAARILREAATICSADLDSKGQRLTIETPGAPYPVDGDSARLHQVFWNLVKNAIKFTPDGGRITIRAAADAGRLRVVVADTGIGIDPAVLPKLFKAFEQGVHGNGFGGLGLGLAIARAVVEMHGGSIHAHSDGRNLGTAITVELPLASADPCQEAAPRIPEPAALGLTRPLRILLVEDHPDTARLMARLLTAEGHAVTHAESVEEALAAAEQREFDVLMSDLGLPDGTGYELMQRLVAAGRPLRGVAVSGYGTAEDVRRSLEAGFVEHLTKPVTFTVLHDVLNRVGNGKTH